MSTPQNPGDPDGEITPQDPSNPQNPYAPPPVAPGYGSDPTGVPAAPPYGQPSYGQPPYGQPSQQPYQGQPSQPEPAPYPQSAYSQPAYPQPGTPAEAEPGKGMAITALILSFLCCLAVPGIILAIVVLVKSRRDGRNRGKGLAIAALVVGTLSLVATVAITVVAVNYVTSLVDVNDLREGDCVTADGLTDAESESVTDIAKVSCSQDHDGEVLATTEVTEEQSGDAGAIDTTTVCGPAIEAAGKTALITEEITVTALTDADPAVGDNVACIAYRLDGEPLTSRLGS